MEEMREVPMEFELPLREGPTSLGKIRFVKESYSLSELNIGSLEKRAFSSLTEWVILNREKYYVALRIGVKNPFLTDEGKLSTLMIVFAQYLFSEKNPITEEEHKKEGESLQEILEQTILESVYNQRRNICGLIMNPPQYMIDELKEKLKLK